MQQRQWLALHCSVQHQWHALQRCAEPQPKAPVNNDARGRIRRLIGALTRLGGRVFFAPETTPHHAKSGIAAARPALGKDRRSRPPVVCDTGRRASERARRDKPSRRDPRAHRVARCARRLGGVRQRCHGATARAREMQATHDGGLGARGHLATAAARSSPSPAGSADARAAAGKSGRRDSGHAARRRRPRRAPGAEAAHGPGPARARGSGASRATSWRKPHE